MIARHQIGIDLGNHLVKVARTATRDRLPVAQTIPLDFEPDMGNRGWLDAAEAAVRLAAEGAGIRLSGAKATLLFPANWVEVRWLDGWDSNAGTEEVERLRSFVADRLGQELEGTVWDCWVPAGGESGRVGVAFVNRSKSGLVGELALRLRLGEAVGDALFWSHARLAEALGAAGGAPVGILDWGARAIWFTTVLRGVPQFCRRLPRVMLEDALRMAARSLQVHVREVIQFARRASVGRVPDELSRAWTSLLSDVAVVHVAQLAEELSRTLRYVQTKLPYAFPEQVFLIGGGATLRPLVDELVQRMAPLRLVPLSAAGLPRVLNELTANALASSGMKGKVDALAL